MLTQRSIFNSLLEGGTSYEDYLNKVDYQQERMWKHYEASDEAVGKLSEEYLRDLNQPLKVLAIASHWCKDSIAAIPVIAKLAEVIPEWDFKISTREDNEEDFEKYYTTAGRKKVPVIIFADNDGDEIGRWVERPRRSYRIYRELKERRLPKEEYVQAVKTNSELHAPSLSQEIFEELLLLAERAAFMVAILPTKRH